MDQITAETTPILKGKPKPYVITLSCNGIFSDCYEVVFLSGRAQVTIKAEANCSTGPNRPTLSGPNIDLTHIIYGHGLQASAAAGKPAVHVTVLNLEGIIINGEEGGRSGLTLEHMAV